MQRQFSSTILKGDCGTFALDNIAANTFEHRLDARPRQVSVYRIGQDTGERLLVGVVHVVMIALTYRNASIYPNQYAGRWGVARLAAMPHA